MKGLQEFSKNSILATILAIALVLGTMPVSGFTTYAAETHYFDGVGYTLSTDNYTASVTCYDSKAIASNVTIKGTINFEGHEYTTTSIGKSAFEGCTGLTTVIIPDSIVDFGDSAFKDCTSLQSVTISKGVTSIGKSAFEGCTGLTSVMLRFGTAIALLR